MYSMWVCASFCPHTTGHMKSQNANLSRLRIALLIPVARILQQQLVAMRQQHLVNAPHHKGV